MIIMYLLSNVFQCCLHLHLIHEFGLSRLHVWYKNIQFIATDVYAIIFFSTAKDTQLAERLTKYIHPRTAHYFQRCYNKYFKKRVPNIHGVWYK